MASRGWSSPCRVVSRLFAVIALMLIAFARAESSSSVNFSTNRKQSGRFMTDGEMGASSSSWMNLTSSVFRMDGAEEVQWPTLELNERSVAAIILGGIGASLCTAAGLGGGGLFVPLFNLLLQFDSKTSAALSNFMILGGQSITMALNFVQVHPVHPERSLIDFDTALLLQPNLLLGISIGVILNVVFPNWLITALLTVVLSYMTLHSCRSGVKRWKKESERLALTNQIAATKTVRQSSSSSASENLTESLLKRPAETRFPVNNILALAFVWLAFGAVQVIREGKGGQSKCGVVYWLLTSTQLPLAFIVTHYTLKSLQQSAATSKEASESSDDGFVLGPEESSLFPKMALVTGLLGGMLGIGGAMIINPMLMSAGMHPQVTAATSGFMVVFSSSMSVTQYWLMGRVPVDWALTSAALSAVFSAVGILVVQRIINKYGRASLIVFVVAFVIGVSALLMGYFGGWESLIQFQTGGYMGFHYPC